jgi:hypothetical protein
VPWQATAGSPASWPTLWCPAGTDAPPQRPPRRRRSARPPSCHVMCVTRAQAQAAAHVPNRNSTNEATAAVTITPIQKRHPK